MPSYIALLVLGLAPHRLPAQGATDSTPPAAVWNARTIVWPVADTDGTKFVFLEGRSDVPGRTFSYAYFMPAGYWEHHWHSGEVRVFVMSGAFAWATGTIWILRAPILTLRAHSCTVLAVGRTRWGPT